MAAPPADPFGPPWTWDPTTATAYTTALTAVHHVVGLCTALLHTTHGERTHRLHQIRDDAIRARQDLRADDDEKVTATTTHYAALAATLTAQLPPDGPP